MGPFDLFAWRQRSNLMKKRKPVRHPPALNELAVGKAADVHDINGDWLARAWIDARCLAACPHSIASLHDRFDRKCQIPDATPRILDLRLQDLRTGNIGGRQILALDEVLGADFVRVREVALGKAALYDGIEARQILST